MKRRKSPKTVKRPGEKKETKTEREKEKEQNVCVFDTE